MTERENNSIEQQAEHLPTVEEVRAVMNELAEGKPYREIRKLEDEKGLYILEIEVEGVTPGETIEYAYMRKGHHAQGQISATEIHVAYYDHGIVFAGTSAAKYENGQWRILD